VLEAEACLETARDRLTWRTAKHAIKLLAADHENPARETLLINNWANNLRYCSLLQLTLLTHQKHLQPKDSITITPDPAWIQAPWEDWSPLISIREKAEALKKSHKIANARIRVTYSDASCRNGMSGIGITQQTGQSAVICQSMSIGRQDTCSVLATENSTTFNFLTDEVVTNVDMLGPTVSSRWSFEQVN